VGQDIKIKNIAKLPFLAEIAIRQTETKLERSRSIKRRATAVELREGGNNNVTLASKCFVTDPMQTNSTLCTPNHRSERYKPQRKQV
jgi:hypothetical protein